MGMAEPSFCTKRVFLCRTKGCLVAYLAIIMTQRSVRSKKQHKFFDIIYRLCLTSAALPRAELAASKPFLFKNASHAMLAPLPHFLPGSVCSLCCLLTANTFQNKLGRCRSLPGRQWRGLATRGSSQPADGRAGRAAGRAGCAPSPHCRAARRCSSSCDALRRASRDRLTARQIYF